MNILFVGYGSIAKKHKYAIEKLYSNTVFYALRHKENYLPIEGINSIKRDSIKNYNFDAIIISSPSIFHAEQILELNQLNVPLFVEKPLCVNKIQWEQLAQASDSLNPLIYIACNLRFHPLVIFLKQYLNDNHSKINEIISYCGSYLPNWRPTQDYRESYSAQSKLGGGVDLDLIHEPDLIFYLFGKPNESTIKRRKVSNLKIDSNDWAMIHFEYNDFNATIILNYFRKDAKRFIEIVREKDTLQIDFIKGEIKDTVNNISLYKAPKQAMLNSYENQIKYFFENIKSDQIKVNDLTEALTVLNLVL